MSSFVVLYSDLQRQSHSPEGWGLWQWGFTCLFAGGLTLPLYYWTMHNTGAALLRGMIYSFAIAFLTFAVRLTLSLFFQVPLV